MSPGLFVPSGQVRRGEPEADGGDEAAVRPRGGQRADQAQFRALRGLLEASDL